MLTISSTTGSVTDVLAGLRDIPARVVPYATSTALTRTAQIAAKKDLPDAMRAAFINPTPFTLNSLYVKPSDTATLSARVMVKNTSSRGVVPEKFLFPEVAGGARNEKGFEKALRYAGWLKAGERAMPGDAAKLDAYGNVSGATIRSLLSMIMTAGARSTTRGRDGKRLKKGRKLTNDIFIGEPIGGNRPAGIWRREGQRIRPLFIFTSKQPKYRQRLDFEGIAEQAARTHFQTEFNRAFEDLRAKGKA